MDFGKPNMNSVNVVTDRKLSNSFECINILTVELLSVLCICKHFENHKNLMTNYCSKGPF